MNDFKGTYTTAELTAACSLLPDEFYTRPVFEKNTLAAYAEALVELDQYQFTPVRKTASKFIAQWHGVNQIRLLELHKLLG